MADLLLLIPYALYFYGVHIARVIIVIRQMIISGNAMLKGGKLERFINLLGIKPAQMMVVSFVMVILIGAFLLTLPVATRDAQGLDFVDGRSLPQHRRPV